MPTAESLHQQSSFSNSLATISWQVIDQQGDKSPETYRLREKVRSYWMDFWSDVYRQNGSDSRPRSSDFDNSNYISLLTRDDQRIVAILLHSLISINTSFQKLHPYLVGPGGEIFLDHAKQCGLQTVMTVEFLSVDQEWRKSMVGVSLGQVMFDLAGHLQSEFQADASFFRAREDLKVSDAAITIGGDVLLADLSMHNTPVSLISLRTARIRPNPCPKVSSLSAKLSYERLTGSRPQLHLEQTSVA